MPVFLPLTGTSLGQAVDMAATDELGRVGEERTVNYLTAFGYTILDRNWRCAQGEIDIVAAPYAYIAVVEVKTHRSAAYGHPFEAIDWRRKRWLWGLAHVCLDARSRPVGASRRIGIVGADPSDAALEHLVDLS